MENYKNILSMRVRNAKWFFLFFNLIFKCLEFFLFFFQGLYYLLILKKVNIFISGYGKKTKELRHIYKSPRYGNNEI